MKRKEIEFNAEDLVASVESFADHLQGRKKITLRTHTISTPVEVSEMKPKEIVALRKKLALSQGVFARVLNVPKVTEVSWERGRRKPTGAALRLLDLVRRNPKIIDLIWIDPKHTNKAA
jgi:putative transcriptional regulator